MFLTTPNYDIDSYYIVGKIITSGQNVYAETGRYNYAPLWSFVLGGVYSLSQVFDNPFFVFRLVITGILITVDIGIAIVLRKVFSQRVGILFFLNPISILLTGSHGQFDNLAVLIGMIGALVYGNTDDHFWKKRKLLGILFLSFSLLFKHIFFALPLWWAFRTKGVWNKVMTLLIPYGLFIMSFVPYWFTAGGSIIEHVFLYTSGNNPILYPYLIAFPFQRYISPQIFFLLTLCAGCFLTRKLKMFESFLLYTGIVVLFAPAAANQYFAIVIPLISSYINPAYIAFTLVHSFHMISRLTNFSFPIPFTAIQLNFHNVDFTFTSLVLLSGFVYTVLFTIPKKDIRAKWKHTCLSIAIVLCVIGLNTCIEYIQIWPIAKAMKAGNYTLVHSLYSNIQKIPPLPGTPFYKKLTPIRVSLEENTLRD